MRFRFLLAAILSGIGVPLLAQETVQVYDFTDGNCYYKIVSETQVELSPISYTIECPGAEPVYQGYDGYETDLRMMMYGTPIDPETGEMYEIVGIGAHAFEGSRIRVVSSDHRMRYIGDCAFRNCKSLEWIEIDDYVETIGESAFESCTALKYVRLGEDPYSQHDRDGLTVGSNAFRDTPSLSGVFFVDFGGGWTKALPDEFGYNTFQICGSEESPTRFYATYTDWYSRELGIECRRYCDFDTVETVYTGDYQTPPVPSYTSEMAMHTGAEVEMYVWPCYGDYKDVSDYFGYTARAETTFRIQMDESAYNPYLSSLYVRVPLDYQWKITPAPLSLIVEDVTREYGAPNPEFTIRLEGFVGEDDESVLPHKPEIWMGWDDTFPDESSPVGEYRVSGYISLDYSNYMFWGGGYGTLTIVPAPLTVRPAPASRRYGEENPEVEFEFEGFRNGDTPEVLAALPQASIYADADSPVGEYAIFLSGGEADNYWFNYEMGTLTVEKADQAIEWEQDFYGLRIADLIDLTAVASSTLPVEYVSSDSSVVEIYGNGNQLHVVGHGSVTLTAVQSGNDNYNEAMPVEKHIFIAEVAAESISLNVTEGKIEIGDTMQLEATVMPIDAVVGSLVWESSDTGVATVTESGVVSGVASGEAVITVYIADKPELRSSCNIEVGVVSGVETVASGDLRIIATDGRILISGIDDTLEVTVYNVGGQAVYKGKDREIRLPHGTYIVSAAGKTGKVVL